MGNKMPFGYILLENDMTDEKVTNVEVVDKPHLFYVRFNTVLQSLDCKNRNGRIYNGDALVKGLSAPEITELINNKKWKGECDHPITKDIQRIASDLSKYESHYITKWWREGNLIKGTIESIDDNMYGTALAKRVLQGENPSFSLRALAMLEKEGTTTYVNKPPRVITYDEVNLPSHKEAYAEKRKEKVISDGKNEIVYEGTDAKLANRYKKGETAFAIEANDIKDMLISHSDNLKIVCESFDIDPATVKLANGGRSLTAKSGSDTLVWTLEENLVRRSVDYFNHMMK